MKMMMKDGNDGAEGCLRLLEIDWVEGGGKEQVRTLRKTKRDCPRTVEEATARYPDVISVTPFKQEPRTRSYALVHKYCD